MKLTQVCKQLPREPYEEPEKTYSFMEVLKGMKEGNSYRRRGSPRRIEFYGEYSYEYEDFVATDWVEVN